jgi:hypothetical protein
VIDREELSANAKEFIEQINQTGVPNLGAIVIYWDNVHGIPVIAGNVPKARMEFVLREVLKAFGGLDAITAGGILQ